jgi:hypothetical protein
VRTYRIAGDLTIKDIDRTVFGLTWQHKLAVRV